MIDNPRCPYPSVENLSHDVLAGLVLSLTDCAANIARRLKHNPTSTDGRADARCACASR